MNDTILPETPSSMHEALSAVPEKTLHYFAMYFLGMGDPQLAYLSKPALIQAFITADKADAALDLYLEAKSYITEHGDAYRFYWWHDTQLVCQPVSIQEVIAQLEATEYFGLAACVMLMECREMDVRHGVVYAVRKRL